MLRCGPIGGFFVATALVIASAAAKAAEGGIFCNGTMFFIERLEPNRAMSFKVMGADERQHIISVEGVAIPHNDGWRYQEKSDSDPDQRCTLDIFPRAGGFVMHTIEGARCVSYGGYGAYSLLEKQTFPASSRVRGFSPKFDKDGLVIDFDCERRRFFDIPN
jgi:hypothetical protein